MTVDAEASATATQYPADFDYIEAAFGDRGYFAQAFNGYEQRPGQVKLARVVDQAMRTQTHMLGEGPCGTGKGMAYGVPATWHASQRGAVVLIATANIALQEQLITKDLPTLQEILPWPFRFAIMKGRGNYLCEDRYYMAEAKGKLGGGLFHDMVDPEVGRIVAWRGRTETGDRSELDFVPSEKTWSLFSTTSDDCKGKDCDSYDECWAMRAKQRAFDSDVIVCNFHVLFAHIVLRLKNEYVNVLPPFDFLIVDEAHEFADVARDFFGFARSKFSVRRIAKRADEWDRADLAREIRRNAESFFLQVYDYAQSDEYSERLRPSSNLSKWADVLPLRSSLRDFCILADRVHHDPRVKRSERKQALLAYDQAFELLHDLEEALHQEKQRKVYYIETKDDPAKTKLCSKPIDVAPILHAHVFGLSDEAPEHATVMLVSATLAAGGNFAFVRRELGLSKYRPLEIVTESPFDFERQAMLVVPRDMPEPKAKDFTDRASDVISEVIEMFKGRTLGLFTSYRNLNAVADMIRGNCRNVLVQGDAPRTDLVRQFSEDPSAVLLGVSSFWTGVDVQGESLSAVVIDKLPFPHPGDPVVGAICDADPESFGNYMVPKAIITMRQGVGRLVRSKRDTGVVVICDGRIATKRYGRLFLMSMPKMVTTRNLENIPRFMEEANAWVLSRE